MTPLRNTLDYFVKFHNSGPLKIVLLLVFTETLTFGRMIRPTRGVMDGHDIDVTLCPSSDKIPNMYFNTNGDLVCLAGYPVYVTADQIFNSQIALINATPRNTSASCYIVVIPRYSMITGKQIEGHFNCSSVSSSNPSKFNTTYVYPPNPGQRSFVSPLINVVRINQANATSLRIPCIAANKNMTEPFLFQLDKTDATFKNVTTFRNWTTHYDPSIGFDVTFPANSEHLSNSTEEHKPIVGNYICREPVTFNEVHFRVVQSDFIAIPASPKLTFDKGLITVECYSGNPVYIKLLNGSAAVQVVESIDTVELVNKSATHFDQVLYDAGYLHYAKAVFKSHDSGAQGQIICINSLTSKTLFTWTFDNGYACQCNWNVLDRYAPPTIRPEDAAEFTDYDYGHSHWRHYSDDYFTTHNVEGYSHGQLNCSAPKSSNLAYVFNPCRNSLDCYNMNMLNEKLARQMFTTKKSLKQLKRMSRRFGFNSYQEYISLQTGSIQCSADGYITHIDVQVDMKRNMHFNQDLKNQTQLDIRVYGKQFFAGDKIKFTCYGLDYNLIGPIWWGLEYLNGTMEFISYDGLLNTELGEVEDYVYHEAVMIKRQSLLTMKKDLKAVWCYAKEWGSDEWAYASVNVKVQDIPISQDPPPCPQSSKSSSIVMTRKLQQSNHYSPIISQKRNPPRLITGRDMEIYTPVISVTLFCISNIPVEWSKDGEKILTTKRIRANCRNPDNTTNLNQLYKISTTVSVSSSNATGNYTCKPSTSRYLKEVSTYLYLIGNNRTTFVNEGHHYQIFHKLKHPDELTEKDGTNSWALLPCKTNQPNFIPYLFIDEPETEKLIKVGLDNAYLKFNPKEGFLIDVTVDFIKNDTTTFICSDSRDGSFIGNLITLHRIYDPLPATTSKPIPTAAPTVPTRNLTSHNPSMNNTNHNHQAKPSVKNENSSSSAGFVVCIVVLSSLCVASFLITYKFYKKLSNGQQTKETNNLSSSHELDWASAVKHAADSNSTSSTLPIGNNVGNIIEITNNYNTNSGTNGCTNGDYDEDESLPYITENKFNYKKF